ncbi:hypothetical protein COCC4DRAFT_76733 [Bipolaris maydis ATCC 48331]|uniref:SET domain-containing protein n=2 Tax=Cochliobolus heterostrophus TaxID=5016 RepID=M2UKR8_COCH5|nr:uncharacterized protein COCC4DRAFT_76733 [Bipolaris maydis ATCC 48331]EMD88542.1 hypothetical protein COCHEDRAFT_1226723 [Bipolaris maydis C5]ENH99181.1 hypothetical protein COCC4DRAFT_76733 [Bipolaris maydis ATCC 48331]KAJ6205488.1 hypothetical protein PSV09DRAFT_1226723 [Bipolaris maydis]KAJ6270500.1 hypothetical protein PSV08DRAFT_225015 [Bipolaris maydis]
MKSIIGLSALGGALASSNAHIGFVAQQPLLHNVCPANFILHNEECRPSAQVTLATPAPTFESNTTKIAPFTNSLEDARKLASQTKNFPWSFWPECFTPNDNDDAANPFCVFTNATFASGRGISIVTTKTTAYSILENHAFTDPASLQRSNNYQNPPFYQHEFPGKGRGLIANKTLNRGDQILASTPILITDVDLDELAEAERLALLYRAVDTLPPHTQSLFWMLMGRSAPGQDDALDDRLTTNYFELTVSGTTLTGLFPEIAMMNHDCRPNAAYFFDQDTMTHYVHAIRPIYPGEEITITYINNEVTRVQRMGRLRTNWGFTCACSACSAHPLVTAESDARILQIEAVQKTLNDWTNTSQATPALAELLVSLYEQERLHAGLATAYQHAAEVHASFGLKWEAVRYARKSLELTLLDKGWADRDVLATRKMVRDPEGSWAWKRRVGLMKKKEEEEEEGGCGCGKDHSHS